MSFQPDPGRCWQCHGTLVLTGIAVVDGRRLDDPITERRFCSWTCLREHTIRRLRTGFD